MSDGQVQVAKKKKKNQEGTGKYYMEILRKILEKFNRLGEFLKNFYKNVT